MLKQRQLSFQPTAAPFFRGSAFTWMLLFFTAVVFLNVDHTKAVAEESSPEPQKRLRVGVIGLDTSHVIAFTKAFQQAKPDDPNLSGFDVVAAYPFGSADIESSASRIPKYTEDMKALGVEIVDSIETLLPKVDCVLLETNDGRLHLQQALQVFRTGKARLHRQTDGFKLGRGSCNFSSSSPLQRSHVFKFFASI